MFLRRLFQNGFALFRKIRWTCKKPNQGIVFNLIRCRIAASGLFNLFAESRERYATACTHALACFCQKLCKTQIVCQKQAIQICFIVNCN